MAQNKSKNSVNVESLMKENTLDVQWLKKGNVNSVSELLSLVATTGVSSTVFSLSCYLMEVLLHSFRFLPFGCAGRRRCRLWRR